MLTNYHYVTHETMKRKQLKRYKAIPVLWQDAGEFAAGIVIKNAS